LAISFTANSASKATSVLVGFQRRHDDRAVGIFPGARIDRRDQAAGSAGLTAGQQGCGAKRGTEQGTAGVNHR
jgi:hypothetical protein